MTGRIPWPASEQAGGPIDEVPAAARQRFPDVVVERWTGKFPADDDNVWFLNRSGVTEVQIDTSPEGMPPFVIESDDEPMVRAGDVREGITVVLRLFEG